MSMAPAFGEPQSAHSVPHSRDMGAAADGVVGIVVNQTITPNGYEFYRIFSILWSEDLDSRDYSLNIQERLSKRYGNSVEIYLGQKRVYSAVLPFKYDQLKALCEKAVEETKTNIVGLSMQASDDTDIIKDEM
ncbi:MAG: CsgE family curli-type amyloid fiber assembly protein [Gallionellaceae bacterium]